MTYLKLAWRNVGRNRRRSVLSMVAIGVAAMTIVALFSLIAGMKADMEDNLVDFVTGEVRIRSAEYAAYEHLQPLHLTVHNLSDTLSALDRLPDVHAATARITTGGAVFQDEDRIGLMMTGVDFAREEAYCGIGDRVVAGVLPPDAPRITDGPPMVPAAVGTRVLDRLGLQMGDHFTIVTRTAMRGSNAMTFRVVGVIDFPVPAFNQAGFWAPLADVQRLVRMEDEAGEIVVKLSEDSEPAEAVAAMTAALSGIDGAELEIKHWMDIETTYAWIQMAENVYNFIALFFFVLASTVIVNTTMMSIFERKQEIGTLAAMGMRPGELVRVFFAESLLLATIGAAVGVAVGIGLTAILGVTGINMTEAMQGIDFEISGVMYPRLNLRSTVLVFFFAIAVGGITSLFPTLKITRIQPVEALRDE